MKLNWPTSTRPQPDHCEIGQLYQKLPTRLPTGAPQNGRVKRSSNSFWRYQNSVRRAILPRPKTSSDCCSNPPGGGAPSRMVMVVWIVPPIRPNSLRGSTVAPMSNSPDSADFEGGPPCTLPANSPLKPLEMSTPSLLNRVRKPPQSPVSVCGACGGWGAGR